MNTLDGKRIIVAGAATGIGRATAIRVAAEGATVAAFDINDASNLSVSAFAFSRSFSKLATMSLPARNSSAAALATSLAISVAFNFTPRSMRNVMNRKMPATVMVVSPSSVAIIGPHTCSPLASPVTLPR